jgi:hypothetical protein
MTAERRALPKAGKLASPPNLKGFWVGRLGVGRPQNKTFQYPTRRPGERGVASQNGPGFASSKKKKEER